MTLTPSATAGPSAASLRAQVPGTTELTKLCEDFTSAPETLLWLLDDPQTSLCTEETENEERCWGPEALWLLPELQRFLRILIRVPTRCFAKLAKIILNFTRSHTTHNEACWRSKLLSFRVKFHCAERVSGSHEFLIKEEKRLHCYQPALGTLVTFSSAHSINPNKSGLPASTEILHTGRG